MQSYDGDIQLSVGIDTSSVQHDTKKLAASVDKILGSYTDNVKKSNAALLGLQNQMAKYAEQLMDVEARKQAMESTPMFTQEYGQTIEQLNTVEETEQRLQQQLSELQQRQQEVAQTPVYNDQYNALVEDLARAEKAEEELTNKLYHYIAVQTEMGVSMGTIERSSPYRRMAAEAQIATDRAGRYQARLTDLISENRHLTPGTATEEYRQLEEEIRQLQQALAEAANEAERLRGQRTNMEESGTHRVNIQECTDYQNLSSRSAELQARLEQLVARYMQMKEQQEKTHGTQKKMKFSLKGLSAAFKNSNKSMKMSFKTILKYVFGIRSMFMLFRKLRAAVKESFKTLAERVPEINTQLSDLKNTFGQMKNSLGTAFQPLLKVVVPVLTQIMNYAIDAANAVGEFFAVLTGQKYIYKATKGNEKFADSVSNAGGAAKDANKDIAQYDKLIVISKDTGGGGSGAGDKGGFTQDALDPTSAISDFAEKVKEAWRTADFTEVGSIIGNKIKSALDSINWDNLKSVANKIGKSIATFLNGVFETDGLFSSLGSTIANALNTVISGLGTFASEFHWASFGKAVGDSISTFFNTFDFKSAGVTLSEFATGLLATITTAMANIDWYAVAKGIVDFLVAVDWLKVAGTLATSLLSMIVSAFGLVFGIGSGLTDALAGMFEALGMDGVAGFFKGISDNIKQSWEWVKKTFNIFIDKVKAFFGIHSPSTLFRDEIGVNLIEGMKDGIASIIDSVVQFFKDLWEDIKAVFAGVEDWFRQLFYKAVIAAYDAFPDWMKEGLETIVPGLAESVNYMRGEVDKGITSAEKRARRGSKTLTRVSGDTTSRIKGHWSALSKTTETSMTLLENTTSTTFGNITTIGQQKLGTLPTAVGAIFAQAQTNASAEFSPAKIGASMTLAQQSAVNAMNPIKTAIPDVFQTSYNSLQSIFSASNMSSTFGTARDAIEGAFSTIPNWFDTTFQNAWTNVKNVFSTGGKVFNGIGTGITTTLNTAVNGIIDGTNTAISSPFTGLNNMIGKLMDWEFAGTKPFSKLLSKLSIPKIPKLAQGAVIPPNREFMAILGDQRRGTNIEAPLDTIKQGLAEVMQQYGTSQSIVLQLDGRAVAQVVWDEQRKVYKQTGYYMAPGI